MRSDAQNLSLPPPLIGSGATIIYGESEEIAAASSKCPTVRDIIAVKLIHGSDRCVPFTCL